MRTGLIWKCLNRPDVESRKNPRVDSECPHVALSEVVQGDGSRECESGGGSRGSADKDSEILSASVRTLSWILRLFINLTAVKAFCRTYVIVIGDEGPQVKHQLLILPRLLQILRVLIQIMTTSSGPEQLTN